MLGTNPPPLGMVFTTYIQMKISLSNLEHEDWYSIGFTPTPRFTMPTSEAP